MKAVDRSKFDRLVTIGGSEIGAVLGLSRWASPLDVWNRKMRKTGETEATEPMRWGTLLEDTVAREWASRTGKHAWKCNKTFLHDTLPLSANVDRLVCPDTGKRPRPYAAGKFFPGTELLEVKTSRSDHGWGDDGSEVIPMVYAAQGQQYLGIPGLDVCNVAVLIGGSTLKTYRIARDDRVINRMFELAGQWWQTHVATGNPPAPRTAAEVEQLFPGSEPREVIAPAEVVVRVTRMATIKSEIKDRKTEFELLKTSVCETMKDADTLVLPDGQPIVTWKLAKPAAVLDRKKLEERLGDLTPYTREAKSCRKFNIKGGTEDDE